MSRFKLIDPALFEEFAEQRPIETKEHQFNYCPTCQIPMQHTIAEFQCTKCYRKETYISDHCNADECSYASSIRIGTGSKKGMFYNVSQDYSISQHNATTELLYKYSIEWVGPPPIPKGVLSSAASSYNSIQSNVRAARVNSDATESKNFVHRASIMNQILASLIFHESRAAGNAIPRAIIAKFMQLESSGFAKGDDIVRNAVSRGYIDLALDIDDTGSYVGRYLEALELEEDPSNSAFIEEIVAAADAEFIGSSSHLSSKIVGALLLLIRGRAYSISMEKLETNTDNIKRNTFMRFSKAVIDNIKIFKHIFRKYKVAI